MSVIRIATRYAKSLLELSIEQNKLEKINSDMQMLQAAASNRELLTFLKSPIFTADKKIGAMEKIFSGKVDDLTMAYIRLLINKGREGYLPEIAAEFAHQYKTLKKITSVRITTAEVLESEVLEGIRKKILSTGATTENLDIETAVDPELIGGFVLEFNDKRYDASVQHKLDQLRHDFKQNLYIREF